MSNQRDFEYLHSGFTTQKEAEECLDDIRNWLQRTYGDADWVVTDSLSQGPYGWKVTLSARYRPEVYSA